MSEHENRIAGQLLRAALSKFEAQRQESLAMLDIYLHNSVGVGDHSTIVGEICTATQRLSEAEEAIASLQRNFLSAVNSEDIAEENE